MSVQQKLIYDVVMALAIFLVIQAVLAIGSLLFNLLFAVVMGALAVFAFSVATKFMDRHR